MNRRGFLQAILAFGVAPAVIGSGILMPVRGLWKPRDILGQRGYIAPIIWNTAVKLNEHWLQEEMLLQMGERMALMREMIMYRAIQGPSIGSPRLNAKLLSYRNAMAATPTASPS